MSPSDILRIKTMPGETNDQYRRNATRAVGSMVAMRVSVRATDSAAAIRSARNVHTIHVPGLVKDRELLRRQGTEHHVGHPRLCDGSDHDLATGDFGEFAPT